MFSINDAHVARGVLGVLTVVATAVLFACTLLVPFSTASAQSLVPVSSAPEDSQAFAPPAAPALMPAAAPSGVFEEPYTPPSPPPAQAPLPEAAAAAEPEQEPASVPAEVFLETGIASTYGVGDGFQGNRTACGQIFNTHIVQVAHKTLPCGTLVRVEDADTGKSVVAAVTDRGPYIRGRVVDLSWAAFRELEPAGGLRPVKVFLLD